MANVLRLGQILSVMLEDTMLLKPKRYPRAHVGLMRKNVKYMAFLESFKSLGMH